MQFAYDLYVLMTQAHYLLASLAVKFIIKSGRILQVLPPAPPLSAMLSLLNLFPLTYRNSFVDLTGSRSVLADRVRKCIYDRYSQRSV